MKLSKPISWKTKLHEVIFEADTRAGKLFDIVLLILILGSVAAVMLESVNSIRIEHGQILNIIEWGLTILFSIEYITRIISIKKPLKYIFSFYGLIDLLSILPTYLGLFITGASCFVGRHVVSKVHTSGHDILASRLEDVKTENNSNNIDWLYGNLSDLEFLKKGLKSFNPDVVIHLAWQGIPDYSEIVSRTNLYNSIKFFEFIFNNTNCKKVLVTGSCWEYGKKQGACKESDPVNIESYFTWAKNSLNQYLQIKCAERKITLNWFRIFYVYGPGQRAGSLIPTLIKSIAAQEIPNINTPLNKNDFAYVGDVADAIAKAVDTALPSGVYNLGSGYTTSVYDICWMVEKQLLDSETISNQVLENGQPKEAVNFWADMGKINNFFNNMYTPINDGISNMVGEIG